MRRRACASLPAVGFVLLRRLAQHDLAGERDGVEFDREAFAVVVRPCGADLGFTTGDRILFLQTGKIGTVQVDNGSLGTVLTASTNALSVRLDNGTTLSITPETYDAVAHGYAATIHKSQGATVDTALVLVTSMLDRHKAYVAFSRHRRSLSIYAPQDQLRGSSLAALLSRSDPHANALGAESFRDRRGIETPATARERAMTSIATRRLLVSDAWNRLEDAAAAMFARNARTVHLGDLVAVRRDLVRIGYLPDVARQSVPSPHPGLSITIDGVTLKLRAADMPLRNPILADLQPTYRRDRTIAIRMDIQQPGAVTGAFDKLARYYRGLLVPPTSPDNGIAITEAQFAAASVAPAGSLGTAWSSAANLMTMIERHFGRADRVTGAQAVVAREEMRSIRR